MLPRIQTPIMDSLSLYTLPPPLSTKPRFPGFFSTFIGNVSFGALNQQASIFVFFSKPNLETLEREIFELGNRVATFNILLPDLMY